MSLVLAWGRGLAVATALGLGVGCHLLDPPPRPEATCLRACEARAPHCERGQCLRGCNLALDKLEEREGARVVSCVAHARPACGDEVWAGCAVRTGPHADGGPGAPPPPKDYDPDDDSPPPPPKSGDEDDLDS